MVRFNTAKPKSSSNNVTVNYEGGHAFSTDKYTELYLRTATQLVLTDKFYGDKNDQFNEWITLVRGLSVSDPEYVLKLAAYVRNEMKLRSAPIIMLVEAILTPKPLQYANNMYYTYASRIIQRADELAEIIAYYISLKGDIGNATTKGSLPNVLKKIINNELLSDKFNDYQLVKNDKNNAKVSLRDVLRITHPKPKDPETAKFFGRIIKQDSFSDISEQTWEGIISKAGSNKESWTLALSQMPIMALIRNLRNLLDNDVNLSVAYEKLSNPDVIKKSRLLPFRFYQAYKEVKERDRRLDKALENALLTATMNNIPEFAGRTAIFVDTSGSMSNKLNDKSKMEYVEIAALFGAILHRKLGENAILFGYDDKVVQVFPKPDTSLFHTIENLYDNRGGATYAYKCIEALIANPRIPVDRIVFLSDEQSYTAENRWYGASGKDSVQTLMQQYRKKINPNTILYDIDLSGYGTVQFDPKNPQNIQIAGWSERIFDLMNTFDKKVDIKETISKY